MNDNVFDSDCNRSGRIDPEGHEAPLLPHAPDEGFSDRDDRDLAELLNIRELSQVLRKSKCQIRRLTKNGKLPKPIYVGDTPLWPKPVIQAWLRRQVEGGGA